MNAHPGCFSQTVQETLISDLAVKIIGAALHYSNNNSICTPLRKIKP